MLFCHKYVLNWMSRCKILHLYSRSFFPKPWNWNQMSVIWKIGKSVSTPMGCSEMQPSCFYFCPVNLWFDQRIKRLLTGFLVSLWIEIICCVVVRFVLEMLSVFLALYQNVISEGVCCHYHLISLYPSPHFYLMMTFGNGARSSGATVSLHWWQIWCVCVCIQVCMFKRVWVFDAQVKCRCLGGRNRRKEEDWFRALNKHTLLSSSWVQQTDICTTRHSDHPLVLTTTDSVSLSMSVSLCLCVYKPGRRSIQQE